MRSIFTLFFISFLHFYSGAQDSTIALSEFELFTGQPNRILKKELRAIGNFGWQELTTFKTTDVISGASRYAIRIGNFDHRDMPNFINPTAIYIDFADLDSVIQVLDFFLMQARDINPSQDVEFSYITPNDIEFGAYYDASYKAWSYAMRKRYKSLRTYVSGSVYNFNGGKRFSEFVALLKEANTNRW